MRLFFLLYLWVALTETADGNFGAIAGYRRFSGFVIGRCLRRRRDGPFLECRVSGAALRAYTPGGNARLHLHDYTLFAVVRLSDGGLTDDYALPPDRAKLTTEPIDILMAFKVIRLPFRRSSCDLHSDYKSLEKQLIIISNCLPKFLN